LVVVGADEAPILREARPGVAIVAGADHLARGLAVSRAAIVYVG
jgi:hypothetical protein